MIYSVLDVHDWPGGFNTPVNSAISSKSKTACVFFQNHKGTDIYAVIYNLGVMKTDTSNEETHFKRVPCGLFFSYSIHASRVSNISLARTSAGIKIRTWF